MKIHQVRNATIIVTIKTIEKLADDANINIIRYWEKEIK